MIDPTLAATAVTTGLDLLRGLGETEKPKAPDAVNKADFLTLLIAQLQNQDPLNPLDGADFSAQLAQFSALEQLTQINSKIDGLGGGGGADEVFSPFELLGLLGRDVHGVGSSITVAEGAASTLQFEVPRAGNVEGVVIDANGRQVASVNLGQLEAGTHTFDPGSLPNMPTLADGTYTVLLTQTVGDQLVPLATTVAGRVTGVDFNSDPPVLLIGETRLALEDVRVIREPHGS
jgi:flagellar basal-body rod modification protein FlgD